MGASIKLQRGNCHHRCVFNIHFCAVRICSVTLLSCLSVHLSFSQFLCPSHFSTILNNLQTLKLNMKRFVSRLCQLCHPITYARIRLPWQHIAETTFLYNFWLKSVTAFMFGVYIPGVNSFQVVILSTAWPWPCEPRCLPFHLQGIQHSYWYIHFPW